MIKYKIVHYCERGRESRDCTVRAVAAAFNLPYDEAHARLAELGRKPRKGFDFRIGKVQSLGKIECRPDLCCLRIESLWPSLEKGRFIVKVPHHVFAVVDGVAHDLFAPKPRQRVKMVYEVIL
jgi:hypothetical protein